MADWMPPAGDKIVAKPSWTPPADDPIIGGSAKPSGDLPWWDRALHGFARPFEAISELGAHLGVQPFQEPSSLGQAPPTPVEAGESARRFETDYQTKRTAAGGTGMDWASLAGEAANPLLWGVPAIRAETTLGRIAAASGGAMAAGALNPTERGNFWVEKLKQTTEAGALGGVLGGSIVGIGAGIERAGATRVAAADIEGRAADIVGKRIEQDARYGGPTATDAIAQIGEARKAGKPFALVDVGEENVRALGGYVTRQPGEGRALGRSFLEARDKAAAERLTQDVNAYVSSGPPMLRATEDVMQGRSAAARPLYAQFEGLQGLWSPELQGFLNEPEFKQGLALGYKMERLEARGEGRKFDPTAMGVDLDFEGNVVLKRVPNPRVLDMAKRGLDAMIANERDSITGRLSAMGRSLTIAREGYMRTIDKLDTSGIYRQARDAWAGSSRSLDAMRFGRTIFNRSPEETTRDFARMTPNDQEFARLGVADVLRERIAKTGFDGNEARAVIKNAWTRDQLRSVFPDVAAFDKFAEAVSAEHTMAGTKAKLIRGSQTAERVAEDSSNKAEAAYSAWQTARHVVTGNFPAALVHAWRMQRRLQKDVGDDPALNAAVARIIFNPKIEINDPAIQRITGAAPKPPPSSTERTGNVLAGVGVFTAPGIGLLPGEAGR